MSVLRKLNAGEEAVITGFKEGVDSYRKKLLSMGLTKGTKVKLLKVAPMGDPIEIEVRGFKLSLRKGEADVLKIRSDKCSPKR
ncbi:MAG: ferrous iron transport protein A [Spirochaetia bacterium]